MSNTKLTHATGTHVVDNLNIQTAGRAILHCCTNLLARPPARPQGTAAFLTSRGAGVFR